MSDYTVGMHTWTTLETALDGDAWDAYVNAHFIRLNGTKGELDPTSLEGTKTEVWFDPETEDYMTKEVFAGHHPLDPWQPTMVAVSLSWKIIPGTEIH